MTNEIDDLWAKIADDPLLEPDEIDSLITYYRNQRTAGPRPKKDTGPTAKIDMVGLGLLKEAAPAAPTIRRRL